MVDPVVVVHVQLVQLVPPLGGGLPVARLEVHDADPAEAHVLLGVAQQRPDLGRIRRLVGLRQGEQVAHRGIRPEALQVRDEALGSRFHPAIIRARTAAATESRTPLTVKREARDGTHNRSHWRGRTSGGAPFTSRDVAADVDKHSDHEA